MIEAGAGFTPGEFARQALKAIEASEARTMRRKRDQLADVIGLGIKRGLLARAAEAEPSADAFEGWLMEQALGAAASGGILAMCVEILDEYRLAAMDQTFQEWLAAGAPSADAEEEARADSGGARARRRREQDGPENAAMAPSDGEEPAVHDAGAASRAPRVDHTR